MNETVFDELKRYVDFSPQDEASLRWLDPVARPQFEAIATKFYERILAHDGARQVLEGGESKVGRLKLTLIQWLERLLTGPWDEAYFDLRCRIGRAHVRINLPQHYMFGAMNVVREELLEIAGHAAQDAPTRRAVAIAVDKVLDLELAIMLHTYREDLLARQARSERLSTFGQLVGSIGHELRNPLAVIESSLFILKGRPSTDEKLDRHLARIGEQVHVANHIISNLLDLIRDRPITMVPVSLNELIGTVGLSLPRPEGVQLEVMGLADLRPVAGDPHQLRQVFFNLLENAIQAVGPNGRISIEAKDTGSGIECAVTDSGPGVDQTIRHRLFEPLITTKPNGNGLGLALVRRILERHGGTIAYEPVPGQTGARFVIRLS